MAGNADNLAKARAAKQAKQGLKPDAPAPLTEEQKAANKATREAALVKARADKAAIKVVEQAKKDNAEKAIYGALVPVAKEINVRFAKANELDGKADDHRLAAAIQLAKAKTDLEANGMNFKKWVEANVTTQSYETVRKLATVGSADDPKQALTDMRTANKDANKKSRDAKKALPASAEGKNIKPAETPIDVARAAMKVLPDDVAVSIAQSRLHKQGLAVVNADDVGALKELVERDVARQTKPVEHMMAAFKQLKASEKQRFVEWAAKEIGSTLKSPFDAKPVDAEENADQVPVALRRKSSRAAAANNGQATA